MSLTYTQLAYFDDLLVDCLIDRLFYWSTTRKVRDVFRAIRGIPVEKVLEIIHLHLVDPFQNGYKPALSNAVEEFVSLPSVRTFLLRFPDPAIKHAFERHVRRYLQIYSPDCGFDVEVTDRYKSRSNVEESCIIARKNFKEGEEIKGLTGVLVQLTETEEKELMKGQNRDFSIINSSRSGGNCLMLGPARFVNHDCKANAKFVTLGGGTGMRLSLHSKTEIQCGEQITVEYGPNYFGKKNKECLCSTCESLRRNGFAATDEVAPTPVVRDESESAEHERNHKDQTETAEHSNDTNQLCISGSETSSGGSTPLFSGPPSRAETPHTSMEPENEPMEIPKRRRSRKLQAEDMSIIGMFKALYNASSETPSSTKSTRKLIRQRNIDLMKSYYRRPLIYEGDNRVTDCENCHVPVIHDYYSEEKLSVRQMERRMCPRCHRHAILYNAYWPLCHKKEDEEEKIQLYESLAERLAAEENRRNEDEEDSDDEAQIKKKNQKNKRVFLPAVIEDENKIKAPRRISLWHARRMAAEGINLKQELKKMEGPRPDSPPSRKRIKSEEGKSMKEVTRTTDDDKPLQVKKKRLRDDEKPLEIKKKRGRPPKNPIASWRQGRISTEELIAANISPTRIRKPSRKLLEAQEAMDAIDS